MEKIESFKVDHTKLEEGIYLSREDRVGDTVVSTYDLRFVKPNSDDCIPMPAAHTIEHLGATFFRNKAEEFGLNVIYFGPMGCQTGFYLILEGKHNYKELHRFVCRMLLFIQNFSGDIPGVSEVECGNYTSHSLLDAKLWAQKFFIKLRCSEEVLEKRTLEY